MTTSNSFRNRSYNPPKVEGADRLRSLCAVCEHVLRLTIRTQWHNFNRFQLDVQPKMSDFEVSLTEAYVTRCQRGIHSHPITYGEQGRPDSPTLPLSPDPSFCSHTASYQADPVRTSPPSSSSSATDHSEQHWLQPDSTAPQRRQDQHGDVYVSSRRPSTIGSSFRRRHRHPRFQENDDEAMDSPIAPSLMTLAGCRI